MRTAMIVRLAAVAATSTLLATSTAAMADPAAAKHPAQHWSEVTPGGQENFANIGLALGSHGALNVFWASNGLTPGKAAVMDTPVTYKGAVGKAVAVVSHQYSTGDPDATVTGSRIDVVWDGTSKTPGGQFGTFIYTRAGAGGTWSEYANVPPLPGAADTSADSAATGADGKPWFAVSGSFSLLVDHVGFAEREISPSGCCVYNQGLAVNGKNGAAYISYDALAKHSGVFALRLNNNGTPAGKAVLLPDSLYKGNFIEPNERIGITGRGHGRSGVYVTYMTGYPFAIGIDLYEMGARKPVVLAKTTSADGFYTETLAADAQGGLWAAWSTGGGSAQNLWVRQSNNSVTKWGKALHVALPRGTSVLWNVFVQPVGSRLDIVALLGIGNKTAFYYTQV
jgi:hypothetical protein